uniref:Uncharacterized protein n=1 Tax=Apteryx owenii TaxID=8824 RepID=A0A8B9Q163_APTOW
LRRVLVNLPVAAALFYQLWKSSKLNLSREKRRKQFHPPENAACSQAWPRMPADGRAGARTVRLALPCTERRRCTSETKPRGGGQPGASV